MILRVEWTTHDGAPLYLRGYSLHSDQVEAIAAGLAALDQHVRPVAEKAIETDTLSEVLARWRARDPAADWPPA